MGSLGPQASTFAKSIGLSPSNSPELNASRMADSIWEACGRGEYQAVEVPLRRSSKAWALVPDTDEAVLEAMLGTAPADAPTRTACWKWVTRVDGREYENASRLGGLLWACDLLAFADPTDANGRRAFLVGYVREQYRISAEPLPPLYIERGGNPWALVRLCRRYDVMSKSIRAREILRGETAHSEEWGAKEEGPGW